MTTPTPGAPARSDALPLSVDVLLLDMDGTLVDSGEAVTRAWTTLMRELGSERSFSPELHGIPARQVLGTIFPDLTDAEVEAAHHRIEQLEIQDVEGIEVLPGTRRVLAELDAAATQLGHPTWTIVTSCTRPLFEARWGATGLPAPEDLVTADQVRVGKPDPAPYLLAMDRLDRHGDRALVIEDSAGGLRSGAAAGARTLAVTTTTPAADLAHAEALVTSLDDIEVLVEAGSLLVRRREG
ncbi:HAD-IA family hydrolase [Brachybacterium sp. AOP25-B2-12]|uniref:HAD-IA family hydrolase n=1 Tax=Brachybacterium sp. AOP25-B2-12 TaxID=3457710 RepID=UPI0040349048